jgi:S1-C subfamily serine protease
MRPLARAFSSSRRTVTRLRRIANGSARSGSLPHWSTVLPPPYSIGIQMGVDQNGLILIHGVLPDGAAARAGIKDGNLLLEANNVKLRGSIPERMSR